MKVVFCLLLVFTTYQCAFVERYQYTESAIRVNQVGYLTLGKKQAVIVTPKVDSFKLHDPVGKVVFKGKILERKYWEKSGEEVAIADFTAFGQPGSYYLSCGDLVSHKFRIADDVFVSLVKAAAKAYYFNRASTALDTSCSGLYGRPYAHPDTSVFIHESAATEKRPVGTKISTPYGWYDAGDYNKYVVNSGITTYTLLMALQHNAGLLDTLTWDIPESKNSNPDLLDEILWNVRWMESMQDPNDGGVYHKTTTADFEQFVPACEATGKRYVVSKGTGATLNFCAVLARTAATLRESNPEYSAQLLKKAEFAWQWALTHPDVVYKNPSSVSTGGYGDPFFLDEFFWAAAELYLATGKETYLRNLTVGSYPKFGIPSWGSVETLGLISLSSAGAEAPEKLRKQASDQLLRLAEGLIATWREAPCRVTLTQFRWGSNSDILNQGMVLINAYRLFGNSEFYEAALSSLDYVLGRNATGYCFVTGQGSVSPMHIHHRQSASDDVEEPVPGFLVGGPNPGNVHDDCGKEKYPTLLPARCYLDDECSYSTNEVAINWNAPLVYMSSTLQGIYFTDFDQ